MLGGNGARHNSGGVAANPDRPAPSCHRTVRFAPPASAAPPPRCHAAGSRPYALVHRPYIQRGDIFLNLHPGRLEVVNPGPLPLGGTPQNVLHTTVRRNEHLARLFHDLKLMEREGSGFDKIFEVQLSQGRPAP